MKLSVIMICLLVFNCIDGQKKDTSKAEHLKFETQIISKGDIKNLDEGYNNGWQIVKDDQIAVLANRDMLYYIFKNPTVEQLKPMSYLHVISKETEEFINLDFNFNDHQLESKTADAIY